MKSLSLTQPWATLIAIGAKQVETRSWNTRHRGLIAIHAAKGLAPVGGQRGFKAQCGVEPFCSVLNAAIKLHEEQFWHGDGFLKKLVEHPFMPLGAIVAVATLVEVNPTGWLTRFKSLSRQELAFGNYSDGRFGWVLREVKPLATPIPCKGALRLWKLPADVESQIREQLKEIV